ncbi:YezD family protein [Geomonas edaphica]|uniref:YezD family protein n=1 Tax=Geomonas edaphica TaxID=2570226 RepID=UPI0010A8323D|nr:YezD family protein [Geomonas edaphica]
MGAQSLEPWNPELEQIVRELLATVRFGTLTLVVQDGRVIQVDRNEKYRLNKPGHIDGSGI